jgi:cytidylate kinase
VAKAIQIAIDGPSASGKGTVSKAVASALGYTYLDSGALYRVVALVGGRRGLSLDDGEALAAMVPGLRIRLTWEEGSLGVSAAGKELSEAIRFEEIGQEASRVAKLPELREALLSLQRELAAEGGIVMDGRDIGTVVLPEAELKIFLTASVDARAGRRHAEQLSRGIKSQIEEVTAALQVRDAQDANREHAPLRQAEDALCVDSTGRSPTDVLAEIVALARERNA